MITDKIEFFLEKAQIHLQAYKQNYHKIENEVEIFSDKTEYFV